MLTFIQSVIAQAALAHRESRERKRLYQTALRFNLTHTFSRREEWMCPNCNAIHKRAGHSLLTGYQFPACCSFSEGHRLYYRDHATGRIE